MTRLLWLAVLTAGMQATPAHAEVQRFALIVGNNAGHADDAQLAYAEDDAEKVHRVLRELGGFRPQDMVLLKGGNARSMRQTLIALNDRIRNARDGPQTQSLLLVYYSGHADAAALRLGEDRMDLRELSQLVRGSAASFRLMVVDACRSKAQGRRKGGRIVSPFALPLHGASPGEGVAFLWASAADEDAQESDRLRGSFFTHAWVSWLLGAADVDGDGAVALEEAYRYAYDATLRATSRTAYGVQHPSFDYDYRGHGALILTHPGAATGSRGTLRLPPNIAFLVMQGDENGPVVAELSAKDPARALSLRAGRYFLRGRASDVMFEGQAQLTASQSLDIDTEQLDRVQYARLVRKGGRSSGSLHSLDLGFSGQSHAPASDAPCWGGLLGYSLELEELTLTGRLGACRMRWRNELVEATTLEYDLSLGGLYTWDLDHLSLAAGVAGGASIAHQRFATRGHAPSRTSTAPYIALLANATVELGGPVFARLVVRAATRLVKRQPSKASEPELDIELALRAGLLVGLYLSPSP